MELANLKYKALNVKGKWNAPSEEEEKILALEAKIKAWSDKKRTNYNPNKGKKASKPAWMNEPPGVGASTRVHKDKTWYWCDQSTGGKCGGAWRIHKPSECKGNAYSATHFCKDGKGTPG